MLVLRAGDFTFGHLLKYSGQGPSDTCADLFSHKMYGSIVLLCFVVFLIKPHD